MRVWYRSIQAIGIITVVLCCWGSYLLFQGLTFQLRSPFANPNAPRFREIFFVMNAVNAAFLVGITFVSFNLLKPKRSAVKQYTWIFVCLAVYSIVPGALWNISGPVGASIAAASGVGNVGLGPLLFFPLPLIYPVLSVVLLQISARRLWPAPTGVSGPGTRP